MCDQGEGVMMGVENGSPITGHGHQCNWDSGRVSFPWRDVGRQAIIDTVSIKYNSKHFRFKPDVCAVSNISEDSVGE